MDVIGNAPDRQSCHPILAGDSAEIGMQPISHLVPNPGPTASRGEDDVQQTAKIAVRHKTQPSLTGLLFVWNATQHWIRRLTASNHAGLLSNVPAGLYHSFQHGSKCTNSRLGCTLLRAPSILLYGSSINTLYMVLQLTPYQLTQLPNIVRSALEFCQLAICFSSSE